MAANRQELENQIIQMIQTGQTAQAMYAMAAVIFEDDSLTIAGQTFQEASRITIFDAQGNSGASPGELGCVGMTAPNGQSAYQVPAGKRLVIRATRSQNPLQLGYADDAAPTDGTPVDGSTLTNPIYQGGVPFVGFEQPNESLCEFVVPAGKYPFSGLTNGGNQSWQIFGELLDA